MKSRLEQLIIALATSVAFLGFSACDSPAPVEGSAAEQAEASEEASGESAAEEVEEAGEVESAEAVLQELAKSAELEGLPLDQESMEEALRAMMPAIDFEPTEEQIEQFVKVSHSMQAMEEEIEAEMATINSPEEFMAFQEKMTTLVEEQVEAVGMDLETFLKITQRVAVDPEFRMQLEAALE